MNDIPTLFRFLSNNAVFVEQLYMQYFETNTSQHANNNPVPMEYQQRRNNNSVVCTQAQHNMWHDGKTSNLYTAFVCNIPFECKENEIKQIFDNIIGFENSTGFKLVDKQDLNGNITKRFAFVTVSTRSDLDKIVEGANGIELEGRRLVVRFADDNYKTSKKTKNYNNNSKSYRYVYKKTEEDVISIENIDFM